MDTREKIGLILAATMLGSSSTPRYVNNNPFPNESTNENIPNVLTLQSNDPILSCQNDPFFNTEFNPSLDHIDEISEVSEYFDIKKLEIESLEGYELKSVEDFPEGMVFETLGTTPMYIVPTDYDEKIVTDRDLKQIKVQEGMNFELAQKRTIENKDGESIEIGIIRNTYGGSFYVAAIPITYRSNNGEVISFIQENNKIDRSVSYISTDSDNYPNKIMNIMLALANSSEFQDLEGKFKKGEPYSFISMIGIDRREKLYEYKLGYNSAKTMLLAGGACASATGVSTLMHLVDGSRVDHLGHPNMYAQGPFAPWAKDVDATVEIWRDENNKVQMNDLLFRPGRDGYIKIDLSLVRSGVDYAHTDENGLGGTADVALVISFSYTDKKPISQTADILHMLDQYELYRESKHTNLLPNVDNGIMKQYTMDESMEKIANLLYTSKE